MKNIYWFLISYFLFIIFLFHILALNPSVRLMADTSPLKGGGV